MDRPARRPSRRCAPRCLAHRGRRPRPPCGRACADLDAEVADGCHRGRRAAHGPDRSVERREEAHPLDRMAQDAPHRRAVRRPPHPQCPEFSCVTSWLSVRGRANLAPRAADGLVTTKKNCDQFHRPHDGPPKPCVEHEEHEPTNPDSQQQGDTPLSHLGHPWQPNLESRSISVEQASNSVSIEVQRRTVEGLAESNG